MQTSVTFKNFDSSNSLKSYVEDKLNRFDRLLDSPSEASVVLSVEKLRHIVEINLSGGKININAKEENSDMHAAIDLVLDKLKKQIKKQKQKMKGKRSGSKERLTDKDIVARDSTDRPEETDMQLQVQNIEYKPMDIEEAIMQMGILGNHFLVFTNSRTDRVNVIYRRKNGGYSLIQPSS